MATSRPAAPGGALAKSARLALLVVGAHADRAWEAVLGDIRVQALSPTLLRVEPKGPNGFEDRSTFMVANRSFPHVSVALVEEDDAGGGNVRTDHYTVRLRHSERHICGEMFQDTDAETVPGGSRSTKYPDGTPVEDSEACCAACASDPTCNAWVHTVDLGICYTLTSFVSLVEGSSDRVFGFRPPAVSFQVSSPKGAVLYDSLKDRSKARHLLRWPAPLEANSYALVDHPRFHVPQWGATPVPEDKYVEEALIDTSGYDFSNVVEGDTYVFLLGSDLQAWLASRAEFIALTGPVPLLPHYAYGTWFTWWHPYNDTEAKSDIERWDSNRLPLDVWGLDMNWRTVDDDKDRFYDFPDTDLFPNLGDFLGYLRDQRLHTFFNDHPFPVAARSAGGLQTSPEEVKFRWEGLTGWMERGLSFWWFDVNWGISIPPPCTNQSGTAGDWMGLGNAAWGSHVYFTIVDRFSQTFARPGSDDEDGRGVALTKFARDDARPGAGAKGSNRPPESPAQHRYPVWWTGDGVNLQASVESMVDSGMYDFKPFVHSDCGGDQRGSEKSLLRWTAHCAFGTILRYHGGDHRPWTYDNETEQVVRAYLRTRYKLLPTLIAAGHEATERGFPLVARGDFFWPTKAHSRTSSQYIFLRDILVAPIVSSKSNVSARSVWIPPGEWQDVWSGRVHSGPNVIEVSQPCERQPMYYRRDGGMLVISPDDVTRVAAQNWTSLVVEVFPSTSALNTTRSVYERQAGARTDMRLSTDGTGRVWLLFDLPEEAAGRIWVVRVHLRQGEAVSKAYVDGSRLSVEDITTVEPHESDPGVLSFFPFGGERDRPAPEAGPLAIIRLYGTSRKHAIRVDILTRSADNITVMYSLPPGITLSLAVSVALAAVLFAVFIQLRGVENGRKRRRLEEKQYGLLT